MRSKSLAITAVTCGQHAIEHVDAAGDGLDQVFGRPDSHQITRLVRRHSRRDIFNYIQHHAFLFANAKTADCITVESNFNRALQTLAPQIEVRSALNDAEQSLSVAQAASLRNS